MKICLITNECKIFCPKQKSHTYISINEGKCKFLPLSYPILLSFPERNVVKQFMLNFSYAHLNIHVWITINLDHTKHDVLQFDVFHFQSKVYLGRLIHKPLPYCFYGYPVYNLSHNDCHLISLQDFFFGQ